MAATAVRVTTWQGCYGDTWQDLIVPEAFAHPAKVARGLSHRIYCHLIEQGYVRSGMVILDPFAGIGGFCLDAMTYGLHYVGVELEPRFVALGQQNLDLWRQRYGFSGGTIVQGDSRRLREVLAGAQVQAVVGSPPWHAQQPLAPGTEPLLARVAQRYGNNRRRLSCPAQEGYGTTPGPLGAMPPGALVSSPPYAGAGEVLGTHNGIDWSKAQEGGKVATPARQASGEGYGTSAGQLGNEDPCTFWDAARAIMAELSALLPPGAVCAWVVKAYVKNKAIVPFPQQWQALCEAHGFVLVEEIHASLVEDHGTQEGLFGDSTQVRTEKKSFFRRLAEKKGSPRIDHETVLIVRKAGSGAGVCCVSSPPFQYTSGGSATGVGPDGAIDGALARRHQATRHEGYGTTPGNLGNLPVGRR